MERTVPAMSAPDQLRNAPRTIEFPQCSQDFRVLFVFVVAELEVALKSTQISIETNSRGASGFANLEYYSFWTGFICIEKAWNALHFCSSIPQMLPENATQLISVQSGRTPGLQILHAFLLELDLDGYY